MRIGIESEDAALGDITPGVLTLRRQYGRKSRLCECGARQNGLDTSIVSISIPQKFLWCITATGSTEECNATVSVTRQPVKFQSTNLRCSLLGHHYLLSTTLVQDQIDTWYLDPGMRTDHTLLRKSSIRQLEQLAARVAEGAIKIRLADVLPLAQARRAHELGESGKARGKLILEPTRK
jgi:hypothetical protein